MDSILVNKDVHMLALTVSNSNTELKKKPFHLKIGDILVKIYRDGSKVKIAMCGPKDIHICRTTEHFFNTESGKVLK